ncbi:MAG: ribonuclease VapC [Armatimonadota bacterium]|nr:MAG: ribonuclease VapC [Armatimonadota bacterium]
MFLLDTNIVIYFFKGQGRVAEHLFSVPPSEVALSTVTVYELEVGIARSASPDLRRAQLNRLLETVSVLPLNTEAARAAARVRSLLEQSGFPIGALDNLIAGIALAHGATLVTHNVSEFARVPDLSVVDWY